MYFFTLKISSFLTFYISLLRIPIFIFIQAYLTLSHSAIIHSLKSLSYNLSIWNISEFGIYWFFSSLPKRFIFFWLLILLTQICWVILGCILGIVNFLFLQILILLNSSKELVFCFGLVWQAFNSVILNLHNVIPVMGGGSYLILDI